MKEFKYVIRDELGIHARPTGLLVKQAMAFPCKITIIKKEKEADAKKVFAVMALDVECGDEVTLRTEGEMEDEAMTALADFFEKNL